MGWREQKRKALADVHRQFQIPAVYVTHKAGSPVAVRVRLHRKHDLSLASGGDFDMGASNMVLNDRIIFDMSTLTQPLVTTAYVIFSQTEGYVTGPASPVRDGYAAVDVTAMERDEITSLLAGFDLTTPVWADIQ